MNHDYLLKTNNPDKELEYFWLTFKSIIFSFLDNNQKKEINDLSDLLNALQKDEEYKEIEKNITKYITNHVENIGYVMLSRNDSYKIHLLITNIKRWKNLQQDKFYDQTNVFYCLLKIYDNIYKKKL